VEARPSYLEHELGIDTARLIVMQLFF